MAASSLSESSSSSDSEQQQQQPHRSHRHRHRDKDHKNKDRHPRKSKRKRKRSENDDTSSSVSYSSYSDRSPKRRCRDESSTSGSDSEASDRPRKHRRRDKSKKTKEKSRGRSHKNRRHKHKAREKQEKESNGPVQLSKFLGRDKEDNVRRSAVSGKKILLKVDKTKEDKVAENNRSSNAGDLSNTRRTQFALLLKVLDTDDLETYEDAKGKLECKKAMAEKFVFLLKIKTWELVQLQHGKNLVGFVYKTKFTADGQEEKHMARLEAKGFSKIEGFDYTDLCFHC